MRWRGGRRSSNVEDLRGQGGGGGMRGGGLGGMLGGGRRRGGGMRLPIGKKSGGGLIGIIVIVGITLLLGGDLGSILGQVSGGGGQPSYAPAPATGGATGVRQTGQAQQDELAEFVAVVLGDTEDTWHKIFKSEGATYREPNLVLFDGSVRSACGLGQSAMGPFYCPGDQKVYIDLSFFRDLRQRFKAPGDFAQAYVIAHEVGHHVQTLIGVWAHHADRARSILEAGDIDEALRAAAAIGDDRIQRQSQGYVSPESFTQGSSAQRQRWFKQGLQDGRVATCDTFSARNL